MTPSSPDDSAADSPLATLRQLKEMLDAGAITQQEFDALKQRLIFGGGAGLAAGVPATPAPLPPPPTPYLDGPAALTPEASPLLAPEPDWLAAPAPLPTAYPDDEADAPATADAAERRNPLNLVFAIGGLLLFLGVMAYLTFGRPTTPDEHVTSTSQTSADTLTTRPEVGPQAEQITLPPAAAPETVRVAPPLPAPATTLAAPDSAQQPATPAPATPAIAPKPAAPKATIKPATAAPVTTAPADTAGTRR